MRAESIHIETDEDGFHLRIQVIDGEADPVLDFLLLDPEELAQAVRREIDPWLAERDAVRTADWHEVIDREVAEETVVAIREDNTYRIESDYHSIHVDHYDNRDKMEGAA